MKPKSSKKFSYPHPLVKPFSSHSSYSNNYLQELPPYTYQPFESSPESSHQPCPHIFRTNHYVLGDTSRLNSDIELGCIVSPFSHCEREPFEVSEEQIGRCGNCLAAIKGDWVEDKGNGTKCLMCRAGMSSIEEQRVKGNGSEAVKSVRVERVERVEKIEAEREYVRRILFVVELSDAIESSEIYNHIVNNLELLGQEGRERVEVGFMMFDHSLKIVTRGKNSFSLSVVGDAEEEMFPVGQSQLFYGVDGCLDGVYQILEELMFQNQNRNPRLRSKFNYLNILEMVEKSVPADTQILLIISNHKVNEKAPTTPNTHNAKSSNQKQLTRIRQLSAKLLQKNLVVNAFYFFRDKKPLCDLDTILEYTGGSCFTYTLNRQYHHQDFYYDLYQYLHENHYSNINIRIRTSEELSCTQINHQTFKQKEPSSLSLSKLSQNSNFSVYLKINNIPPGSQRALLNIEVSYKHKGVSKVKIINFEYMLTSEPSVIYSSIGDECQFFLMLRKMLYQPSPPAKSTPAPIYRPLIAELGRLTKKSDHYFSSSKAFTIHSCLMFSVFYTEHLIRHIQSTNSKTSLSFLFKQPCYNWKHLSLERLSKLISMKLYRIDSLLKQVPQNANSDSLPLCPNIKFTYTNIDEEGVYAIDNGRYIYLYVGDNVSPVVREDLLVQRENGKEVEIVSESVGKVVEGLRVNNYSQYLQLRVLGEKDRRVLEQGLFNEGKLIELIKKLAQ